MPWVGFEPTVPASERTKTVHALYCSATVAGLTSCYLDTNCAVFVMAVTVQMEHCIEMMIERTISRQCGYTPN
jgi:hypothetical protein